MLLNLTLRSKIKIKSKNPNQMPLLQSLEAQIVYKLLQLYLYKRFGGCFLPPVTVKVANSYSATEKPALLWAVTFKLYHVAGFKSNTTKLPPALTLFETNVQS